MPARDVLNGVEPLADLLRDHGRRFRERFGARPGARLFFSPGRVNLMGAHLDYSGGPVMPMAVDRGTFIAVRPRDDRRLRLESTLEEGALEVPLDALPERAEDRWTDYPIGVVRHLLRDGAAVPGADVLFGGNLPIGAGLSSSASMCVGIAFALQASWGTGGTIDDCIESALWGEREFVGVHCGIMDPFAVGYTRPGSILWLDCKDRSIDHVPIEVDELSIAVADTGIRRGLAQSAFNERVDECARAFAKLRRHAPAAECLRDVDAEVLAAHGGALSRAEAFRARHVVAEVQRTFEARRALERGDVATFGACMSAAHASLRDLYEVSVPELDHLVETALSWEGVHGARLTGAGFGGCIVVAMRKDARPGFAVHLGSAYERAFGRSTAVEFFGAAGGPVEL